MPAKLAPTRRGRARKTKARPRLRGLEAVLPSFLLANSRAWPHWNRAAIEFDEGVRAAVDECIEEIERAARRRRGGNLKRIEVG